jgi:uncharacterized protein DUF6166
MTTEDEFPVFYRGTRDLRGVACVMINDSLALPLRLDLDNRSPTGFEWGYGGSGPAQLALALLAHATCDDELALRQHQEFKWRVTAKLDRNSEWTLSREMVLEISLQITRDQRRKREFTQQSGATK